ncbi:MAG: type II toxin-antitoxin system HicB family antitoxin [Sporichthyaceae bacterium]
MSSKAHYVVRAERDGAWWGIEVPGVEGAFSQAKRIDQIEAMAREVIALLLDVAEDSFTLTLDIQLPEQWDAAITSARAARQNAVAAERTAAAQIRDLAHQLHTAGLPVRDVGALMGVSHQRVSQLLATR